MPELPSGTVTFLFADSEGSTRLVQALGDAYAKVRSDHAVIIRRAIAAGGGVEVDTAGDSFFAAFPTPHGAVKAAVMAQRGLQSHEWPGGALVRVRMGVHTGEGVASGSHYVGMDVHRAARIGAAAHGGQVIVSAATRGLVEHSLPAETTLRDLGEHRLKDIPHLEHLFDLVVAGLPADYPPPRTLDARPNNLPAQLTSFIGREEQIAEIRQLFDRTRLLTLTGPGGAGKTRLALQIAAETLTEYRDGSFFVDLASVTDPVLVPAVIARALGVPEAPGVSIVESLQTHLRERELLLVVDNFEQVAIGAPVLEQLLTAAPKVKALVTRATAGAAAAEPDPVDVRGENGSRAPAHVERCNLVEL